MKKVFSIVLCLIMTFLCAVPAFAAGTCGCGNAPVIFIDGINACDLILDEGTENETVAFPVTQQDVTSLLSAHKGDIWDMLDADYSDATRDAILGAVFSVFDPISMNPDGSSVYAISPDWHYPAGDGHREGGWFRFCYDWRLDTFEIAAQLDAFISYVKSLTGHDTVHLVGFSMGTLALNAYLTEYGYGGIESVIWYSGAYRGLEQVGQLFTGKISIDADALTGYLHESTDNDTLFNLVSCLVQGLTDIGVTGGMLKVTNKIIEKLTADGSMRQIILRTFGSMPAIWGFVDDTYYEDAKEFIFGGEEDRYAALIEKIDRYHYDVQIRSDEIMEAARQACGKIGVISKYGRHYVPVVVCADMQTDGVIDAWHTSGFATFAPIGKTLGKNYRQAVEDGHNHLSADGVVDASTARYPEYTWFVKNAQHSSTVGYIRELIAFIQNADHQVTVFEDERFPQFVIYSAAEDTAVPLTEETRGDADKKFIVLVRERFMRLIERIRDFWSRLFRKS